MEVSEENSKEFLVVNLNNIYGYIYLYLFVGQGKGSNGDVVFVVWILFIGDVIYNFVDGLFIGVVFIENIFLGISVFLVVLCEEFFYELGQSFVLVFFLFLLQLSDFVVYNFFKGEVNKIMWLVKMFFLNC